MEKDLLLLLSGVLVGVMNAIAGGGGFVGFPVLIAIGGLSPLVANATYNIANVASQLASAYGYRRYIRKVPKVYLLVLVPCALGAFIGAWLLLHTTDTRFTTLVPWLILVALLLFAFQPTLQAYVLRSIKNQKQFGSPLLWISFALIPLSIYGGYFGSGFGLVMLAFLSFTKLHDLHQMNGLRNLAGVVIGVISLLVLAPGGLVDWRTGLILAAGCALGGYGGARASQFVSSKTLRLIVIGIGILTATYLFNAAF